MSTADIRAIKKLADRLQVRDSDVVRYAMKTVLMRLAPLFEEGLRGRSLVPVLLETSDELIRHFNLDLARLDAMVNGDEPDASKRVDREDLRVIAMHGMNPSMATMLSAPAPYLGTVEDRNGSGAASPPPYRNALHRYLYEKYIATRPAARREE
jgi:hypothetical protein